MHSVPCFFWGGVHHRALIVLTSINQEIGFDQSQLFQWSFQCSLVFSCCVSVFLEILLYLIFLPASVFLKKMSQHNKEEQIHQLSQRIFRLRMQTNSTSSFRFCPHNRFYQFPVSRVRKTAIALCSNSFSLTSCIFEPWLCY